MTPPKQRTCPECRATLETMEFEGRRVSVGFCPQCNGIWFDENKINLIVSRKSKLLELAQMDFSELQTKSNYSCPNCSIPLFSGGSRELDLTLEICSKCKGIWTNKGEFDLILKKCGDPPLNLTIPQTPNLSKRPEAEESSAEQKPDRLFARFPFDNFYINLFSIPLAFIIAFLMKVLPGINFICDWNFSLRVHELGHAIFAWLGSHAALPFGVLLPYAAFTSIAEEQSIFVGACVLFLIGYMGFQNWKHKTYFGFLLCVISLLGFFYFSLLASFTTWGTRISWGGVGGEFILGTIFVVGFYYPLPDRIRWDFFRFIFLVVGMYCFSSKYLQWYEIAHQVRSLPLGSMLGGSDDLNGDMQRLLNTYGWSENKIIQSYLDLGKWGSWIILGHYFAFLFLTWEKRNGSQSKSG